MIKKFIKLTKFIFYLVGGFVGFTFLFWWALYPANILKALKLTHDLLIFIF